MTAIAIDLGGTKVAAALFTSAGEPRHRRSVALAGRGGGAVGELIAELATELLGAAVAEGSPARAVGVAVPGIYRARSGTVWAPNIPGWEDFPLVAGLEAALPDVAVRVDSDRACAVLGESWAGSARGCRNVVFLVVGTGIGAGILAEGRVVRGAGDAAGAIGWLALDRPHRPGYRAVGCFEHHASGTGLAAVARERVESDPAYRGPLRAADPGAITSHDVFAAYDAGDPVAARVVDEAIGYWGMAVANLVSLFNPEKIVLGGGVFGPAARFLDRIRDEAAVWAQPISMKQLRLEVSTLGPDAVLHGAARLALDPHPETESR